MKQLRFYEYSGFQKDGPSPIAELPLSPTELQYLRSISESAIPGKEIFKISASSIQATSMVGIVTFGGVQIEILPKLLRSKNSDSSILNNLMFMLSFTHSIDISDSGIGTLGQNHDSFIEAYISIFAQRLSRQLIRFGSPKSYVEKNENLTTIRGKISFSKHSTINFSDQSRTFCEFAELIEDNALSQGIKFVAESLKYLTRNAESLVALNRCIGLLDGVKAKCVSSADIERCVHGKRNSNFIALINLTKMFLKKLRPEFHGEKKTTIFTLLFDMNELFEEFIFQVLKQNELNLNISVQAQKKRRLVSAERDYLKKGAWVDKNLFDTYTDISIIPRDGRKSFIIDTKYKIVCSDRSHYGISNLDAYQILAYRQIHKQNSLEPSVALLYPKFNEDLQKEFRVSSSHTTFMAWTIDISRDLKSNMAQLVNNLKGLIDSATSEDSNMPS
ncbi:MAG: McrC family protein [Bdellovibrio sp.]